MRLRLDRSRLSGITLLESLVALGLLALVIGLLADMASKYSHIISFSREKDATASAVAMLERAAREVEQGFLLLSPGGASPSGVLEFSLIDSDEPSRGKVDPGALPLWEPRREEDLLAVEYRLVDQDLVRSVRKGSGAALSSVVVPDAGGFSCRLEEDDRLVVLEMSIVEERKVETVVARAYRWAR